MQIQGEQEKLDQLNNSEQSRQAAQKGKKGVNWGKIINADFKKNFCLNSMKFIKKIVIKSNENNQNDLCVRDMDKMMLLGQDNMVTIIESLKTDHQSTQFQQISIQTVLYDAKFVNKMSDAIVISSKNMPLRIYKKRENQINQQKRNSEAYQSVGSLTHKKPNSQAYLSPISLEIFDSNFCFGIGQKFMHVYDLNTLKLVNDFTIKNDKTTMYHNKHFSTGKIVNLFQNQKLALVGQFNGALSLIDLKYKDSQDKKVFVESLPKVHMDSITHIITNKSPQNQNYFLTGARKDDFRYLWDLRNLKTFVQCYRQPLYGNQRVGLQYDGKYIYAGNQFGEIVVFNCLSGKQINRISVLEENYIFQQAQQRKNQNNFEQIIQKHNLMIKKNNFEKCIGAITKINGGFVCAIGGRDFKLNNSDNNRKSTGQTITFQPQIKYLHSGKY